MRLLRRDGVRVECFYEVHPRRIGETIGGVPVVDQGALPVAGQSVPVLISAVGLLGGRDRVRGLVEAKGYLEGENFYCVA